MSAPDDAFHFPPPAMPFLFRPAWSLPLLAALLAFSAAPDTFAGPGNTPAEEAVRTTTAPLSFEAARRLHHERADVLRADEAETARARHEAESAKALSGPQVDVSVMELKGGKSISLSGVADMLPSGYQSLVPGSIRPDIDGPRANLTLTWPLYTGGAISAQQASLRFKTDETAAQRRARENQMDAELASRYWGVALARSIEALRLEALRDEEAELNRAVQFEKKGLISRVERMTVEVSRDAARRDLVAARTNTRVAETELRHALREEKLPALETPLFMLRGDLGSESSWLDEALRSSPILEQINAQWSQAREGVRAAEANFRPKVYAFGTKSLIKHYLTMVEPEWLAGIGVTFTLWSSRDRFESLHAAESLVTKADAARAEAVNEIRSAVSVALLRVVEARDEYDLTASTVALARENLRLRESSFGKGLSTALDVSSARTKRTAAEIAQRAAAYKFVVSWAVLHAAAGRMDAFVDSLGRPDLVPEK